MSPFRALFPFLVLAALARADIVIPPPPGQARVRVRLDLGPFADRVSTEHRVRKGDTLGAIAQERLGSAKRHGEILALNPGLAENALPVGKRILLPPRLDPAEAGLPWLDFIDRVGPARLRLFASGDSVRGELFAVPHGIAAGWTAESPGVASGTPSSAPLEVDPKSRVERVERLYRLRGIRDGRMEWELAEERFFDGDGKPVEAAAARPSRSGGPADLLLGSLAAAGFVGLSFALSRRLRARAA